MARQWRIEYENALYHILSRGNEQRTIVKDDNDRDRFLEVLGRMCDRFGIELYAYVVMDNHYHLLLRTPSANLSKSMQWFAGTYTRYFNIQHGRSGHLFQGRFKSFLIENDTYLLQLSYYIHRNPLRAGIVKRLADYRWSSYGAYAYNRKKPDWLKTDRVLSLFGSQDKREAYRVACQAYAQEETKIWEEVKHGLLMGSQEFIETIRGKFLPGGKASAAIPQQKQVLRNRNIQELLTRASQILNCDIQEFIGCRRIKQADKQNRDLLLYFLYDTGWYVNSEIGAQFGLTYSTVSRRVDIIRSAIEKDKSLQKHFNKFKSIIKL